MISLILAGAFTLAILAARAQKSAPFAALWLIPQATPHTYQLGVANDTSRTAHFRLELEVAGSTASIWLLTLKNGDQWHRYIRDAKGAAIRARLYIRSDSSRPYRSVILRRHAT